MELQQPLSTHNRRNWLRSTALTATSATVLPALQNSCIEDHRIPPGMSGPPEVLPGTDWIGGFAQSNPAFAYPHPDLSSLPLLDNLANIHLQDRQQGVKWPKFSWESREGVLFPSGVFRCLPLHFQARLHQHR